MGYPTSETVKAFWEAGMKKYDAKQIAKEDSKWIKFTADWVDFWGGTDSEVFMKNYSTAVRDRIWTAFQVGEARPGWDLIWQMTTMVHELRHVLQYRDDPVLFNARYGTSKSFRTHCECEAMTADMQLLNWITDRPYPIKMRAGQLLDGYNITEMHRDYAIMHLETSEEIYVEGGVTDEIAAWSIDWCEENAPELND